MDISGDATSSNTSFLNAIFVKDNVSSTPLRSGQCTKDKCVKSIEKRLPPIRQPKPKDEEAWNIKSLPTDCVPISKPSKVIENLLKKKQAQHEFTINQIKIQFNTINMDIEAQIRLNSELLKHECADIENDTQNSLEKVDIRALEMLKLEKQDFEAVMQSTISLYDKQISKIDTFYSFLQQLEKQRANKFKIVLKSAYEELHKIAHKLPYELQQYFEHEILEINQMLLSNLRCYADLQLRLNLQADNTNRTFLRKLDNVKSRWREIKRRDAVTKLNEKKLINADCEALLLNTAQGQHATSLFTAQEHDMQETWTRLSPLRLTMADVKLWSSIMQNTINGLDTCARKLIEMYRAAVVTVFNGYFDELQTLTETMLEMGLVDSPEVAAISFELCQPTIESITRQYSDGLLNLETLWDMIIAELQIKLQNTYQFLHKAAHLWDDHYQRLAEAKRIVLKDLKKVIEKNNMSTQDQEVKLNIILDELRQAPSEGKLEDALDNASTALAIIQKAYTSHYTSEVKIIEKYKPIVEMAAETLLSELKEFLHAHPKISEPDPTIQKPRESECNLLNERPMLLPHQMKQCDYQVKAVENWMFGLWEAIEKYIFTCKDELANQSKVWITERSKKLAKRLEVKLACHTSRFSRIKMNINDIRLAELKSHSDRIARHKAGAEKSIQDIKDGYYIYEIKYTSITENYNKKMESIQSKMQTAKSSLSIKMYIAELNSGSTACNEKINELIEEQDRKYNFILYNIRKTAADFCKQMKLFVEEGSFHFDEAKLITKDLKSFEKIIKKRYTAIKKEIQTKEKKVFAQIQKQEAVVFQSLQSSLEEFQFNDKAYDRIKELQAEIRLEAYNIKLLHKQLENSFNEIETKSNTCLGNVTNLDEFLDELNGFTLAMVEANRFLYQPQPVIDANINNLMEWEQQTNVKYENLLFPIIPTESSSLMSHICCALYKSFLRIQAEAQEFYQKHGIIKNVGKVQPSLKDFMKEILSKYKFYHLQCDLLWLELVNELMKLIQRLQKLTSSYTTDFLKQQFKNHLETFLATHTELTVGLTTIKDENKKILHNLYNKLKPLHGCKRNHPLLEELINEMAEAAEEMRNFDIDVMIQPYKETQENYIIAYEEELNETDTKLATLNNVSYDELLNSPLIPQFEQKLTHMKNLLDEDLPESVETGVLAMYYENMTDWKIPSEYEINLKNTQALRYQEFVDPANDDNDDDKGSLHAFECLEKINEEHTRCLAAVDDIQLNWLADVDNYELIFEDSIKRILNLYLVKYQNLPPQ